MTRAIVAITRSERSRFSF